MERLVCVALEHAEYKAVLGAGHVIELANTLQSVIRLGDGVPDEALGIRQRRQRQQFDRGRRKTARRNGVVGKQCAGGGEWIVQLYGISGKVSTPFGGAER